MFFSIDQHNIHFLDITEGTFNEWRKMLPDSFRGVVRDCENCYVKPEKIPSKEERTNLRTRMLAYDDEDANSVRIRCQRLGRQVAYVSKFPKYKIIALKYKLQI